MHKDEKYGIYTVKVRYENSTINLVLKSCQTFAENYFMKLIFPKICTFLCFRRSKHNSHLAKRTS